jgi:hypothetical protein
MKKSFVTFAQIAAGKRKTVFAMIYNLLPQFMTKFMLQEKTNQLIGEKHRVVIRGNVGLPD